MKTKIFFLVLITITLFLPIYVMAQDPDPVPAYAIPTVVMTLAGLFSPWVISKVVKGIRESWLRYVIAIVFSGVMGLVCVLVLKLPLALENLETTIPAFIVLASTSYKLIWHRMLKK